MNEPTATPDIKATEPPHPPVSLKEAKRLLRHWRRMLRKHAKKLTQEQVETITAALLALQQAIAAKEPYQPPFVLAERLVERHLGFAQKSSFREYAESILLAVLFALFLRAFVIEAFKIPTRSMVPTLLEGDHLFVNKFSYGIRIPFTTSHLIAFDPPKRGDVIVFVFPREDAIVHLNQRRIKSPREPECLDSGSLQEEKDYIKRVIGLPGDTIQLINQQIYVNNEPIPRSELYRRERARPATLQHFVEVWAEERIGEERYTTISRADSPNENFGPITVKDDHLFVMGDNRDNSSDSRCWGQVPLSHVKGKALIIWWSGGDFGARWSRLFTLIE